MTIPLIFIDTNIFLDFYRVRKESGLALLERLDGLHENIITTHQVEMEFKKNRQAVIQKSRGDLKKVGSITPAAFLHGSQPSAVIAKNIKEANKNIEKLRVRLIKALTNPTTDDPVYQIAQRLFRSTSCTNLTRETDIKSRIRRLAWKRFILGYPPRKQNDTSTGDAVNWEWIVQCATRPKRDVVIVSRDSDYGITIDDQSFINDWLSQEFKKRISNRKSVKLVDRLSAAFKELSVPVTQEEEKDEAELIASKAPSSESDLERLDAMELLKRMTQDLAERDAEPWRKLLADAVEEKSG